MRNILAINAGSSSLKFQLLKMPEEYDTAIGQIERIGLPGSFIKLKSEALNTKKEQAINNHADAVALLLEMLISEGVVRSYEEIDGVGHRVVHGGEVFSDSVLITDEILEKLEELSSLAPLELRNSKRLCQVFQRLRLLIQLFIRQ